VNETEITQRRNTGRKGLTMFKFLKQRAEQAAQSKLTSEQAEADYTRLLLKAGKDGKLNSSDEARFEQAATVAGKLDVVADELAEFVAGFAAIKQAVEWEGSLAKGHAFDAVRSKASAAMTERHTAKADALQIELDAERKAFLAKSDPERDALTAYSESCYTSKKNARLFKIKHHVLLGIEDPMVVDARERGPIQMPREGPLAREFFPSKYYS